MSNREKRKAFKQATTAADKETHKGDGENDIGMVCSVHEGGRRNVWVFFNKKESEQQQRWKEGWNLNGICDKVTFRKISAPSPLNKKVLIPGKRGSGSSEVVLVKENTAAYETEIQKCTHGFKCFKSSSTSEISIPTFSCVAVI